MKTILAPTDFSTTSKNAVTYAAHIASIYNATLILFNVYQLPVVVAEAPMVLPPIDELEADCKHELNRLKKHLLDNVDQNLRIEYYCTSGFTSTEIIEMAKKSNADLIVTGIKGTGAISEAIIGSTTTTLINESKIPVLSVDNHAKYKKIEKILLACDYDEIKDKNILTPLKDLAKTTGASVHILNVEAELVSEENITKYVEGLKLDHRLEDVVHYFHNIKNNDVNEGIQDFVKKYAIDLVVMIPRSHNLFERLFKESHTKQMAFHTHTPLLTIHE